MNEDEQLLSPEERRKWHKQLLTSAIIAIAIISIAIMGLAYLAKLAERSYIQTFQSVVTQLNELSGKSSDRSAANREVKHK
ncbi:MAG: hypothetical protein KIT34_05190 [Cyanobacteria bacterium TGS_CYA1]|nr:hypothetical protein [Cyanobacteria bacterium TGS_CYA1]